jgi:hypothetical protein
VVGNNPGPCDSRVSRGLQDVFRAAGGEPVAQRAGRWPYTSPELPSHLCTARRWRSPDDLALARRRESPAAWAALGDGHGRPGQVALVTRSSFVYRRLYPESSWVETSTEQVVVGTRGVGPHCGTLIPLAPRGPGATTRPRLARPGWCSARHQTSNRPGRHRMHGVDGRRSGARTASIRERWLRSRHVAPGSVAVTPRGRPRGARCPRPAGRTCRPPHNGHRPTARRSPRNAAPAVRRCTGRAPPPRRRDR